MERIREYNLDRLRRLKGYLAELGVSGSGADEGHGGFLTVESGEASSLVDALERRGITTDARGRWLRLSPDYLTTDERAARGCCGRGGFDEVTVGRWVSLE